MMTLSISKHTRRQKISSSNYIMQRAGPLDLKNTEMAQNLQKPKASKVRIILFELDGDFSGVDTIYVACNYNFEFISDTD